MENSAYATPKSDVTIVKVKTASSVKAVIYGALIDTVGSFVLGVLLYICYSIYLSQHGITQAEILKTITAAGLYSPFGILSSSLGLLVSLLAGYTCAAYSIKNIFRDTSTICTSSIVFGYFLSSDTYTWQQFVVLALLSVAFTFLGAGYWRVKNL